MKSQLRYGILSGILCIGVMLLLYLIDKTWMIKYSKIITYIVLLITMVRATSTLSHYTFSNVFKTSWLTFVVGSALFHVGMFAFMNYVDNGLYDLTREIAEQYLSQDGSAQEIVQEAPISKFRELTFPLVLSFIVPGTLFAIIVAVIKNKDTLID